MLRTDGYGCAYGDVHASAVGGGHGVGYDFGYDNGDGCSCIDIYGDGDSCGNGWGSGRGDDGGANSGFRYSEDPNITVLVINDDPLTTAYQAVTMQTR